MAFKSKIKIADLDQLDFKTYTQQLKKEINKAAADGEVPVFAFSHFKFACGHEGTLLLLGKSGEARKFYKQAKKERCKEKDYAAGTCYFEQDEQGNVQMHVALQEGKGKPAKMKKQGKALFKRLGLTPEFSMGKLVLGEEDELSEEEVEAIEQLADEENEQQRIGKVYRQYQKLYKQLAKNLIPLIKLKAYEELQAAHFELARAAFKASASFLDKYEELTKDKLIDKFATIQQKVQAKHEQLQQIAAHVKKALSQQAQVHGQADEVEEVLEDVEAVIEEMHAKFKQAFQLIEEIRNNKVA